MKIETPILRRLGPVPFWRGETKCLDELERIYRRARTTASERLGRVHAPDVVAVAPSGLTRRS